VIAPLPGLLKERRQGENYILSITRMHRFKACVVTAQ
jgi:hypothetical protein